jgi:hypothetical protein
LAEKLLVYLTLLLQCPSRVGWGGIGCYNIHGSIHGLLNCPFFICTANQVSSAVTGLCYVVSCDPAQLLLQPPILPPREHSLSQLQIFLFDLSMYLKVAMTPGKHVPLLFGHTHSLTQSFCTAVLNL